MGPPKKWNVQSLVLYCRHSASCVLQRTRRRLPGGAGDTWLSNSRSLDSGAYAGLQEIHDSLGVQISHIEARSPPSRARRSVATRPRGTPWSLPTGLSSRTSPKRSLLPIRTRHSVVTSGRRARLNVSPLIFRLEEASYLAGMVAAGVSKTGRSVWGESNFPQLRQPTKAGLTAQSR